MASSWFFILQFLDILYPENESSKLPRNVGIRLCSDTASYRRRTESYAHLFWHVCIRSLLNEMWKSNFCPYTMKYLHGNYIWILDLCTKLSGDLFKTLIVVWKVCALFLTPLLRSYFIYILKFPIRKCYNKQTSTILQSIT